MVWACGKEDEYRMARRVLMAEVSAGQERDTEVRLDGWCEGCLGPKRNDDGGCAKDWRALAHK